MAKPNFTTPFEIGVAMGQKPNKKFSVRDFAQSDEEIRTIQRRLKELEQDGKVTSDNGSPKGYKLAVLDG